ncbi:MAG: response regulator [Bryobacteraceae bacterium]
MAGEPQEIPFRGRVLLIEDEHPLARLMDRYIRARGFQVETCGLAQEALSLLSRPVAYDAVVSDWSLPDMPGEELMQRIVSLCPGLPVVVCSGYALSSERLPPNAMFLQKPFPPQTLAAALDSLIPASDS